MADSDSRLSNEEIAYLYNAKYEAFVRACWRFHLNHRLSYAEFVEESRRSIGHQMRGFLEIRRRPMMDLALRVSRHLLPDRPDLVDGLVSYEIPTGKIDEFSENVQSALNSSQILEESVFPALREMILSYQDFDGILAHLRSGMVRSIRDKEGSDVAEREMEQQALRQVLESWTKHAVNLTPSLIASVRDVSWQYIAWLQNHVSTLDRVAWEAFEHIIAEVFASNGFRVDITARTRNASADLIAIRTDEFGVETRYLVECKRYASTRKVGLDVVNAVIGAARRADVDHAFLVTSSAFTADVRAEESRFRDLRLHLRDGRDVVEWLAEYTPRDDEGLWLSPGWDVSQRPRPSP